VTTIAVTVFAGEMPKVEARLLETQCAARAVNCDLRRGSLRALRGPGHIQSIDGEARTIFKHDVDGWLAWPGVVSVVKSAVLDVDGEAPIGQLLITGDRDYPTMYLAGGEVHRLGIPRPGSAPIINSQQGAAYQNTRVVGWSATDLSGAPPRYGPNDGVPVEDGDDADVEPFSGSEFEGEGVEQGGDDKPNTDSGISRSTSYCYTLIQRLANGVLEYESAPSPPSELVDVMDGDGVSISGFEIPQLDGLTITAIRIYRTLSGMESSDFHFVVELSIEELEEMDWVYVDVRIDADISSEILQTTIWDAIPEDAKGLIKTDNGIYAAFRGNELLVSEPFIPYAFPASYALTVEDAIVALSHVDGTIVVLTEGRPYLARGGIPESLELVHLPIEQSCVSARSVATMPGGVVYASPDGLMLFTGNEQTLITEQTFTRDQWQALGPENITGTINDGSYIGFFAGTNKGFMFCIGRADIVWLELDGDVKVTALYHHSKDDAIYLSMDTKDGPSIWKFEAGEPLRYTWRSKVFFTSALLGMSAARVEGDQKQSSIVRMDILAGKDMGRPRDRLNLTDTRAVRIRPTRAERLWSFELSGKAPVYEARIAGSIEGLEHGQ
jgi:hypothetical protein